MEYLKVRWEHNFDSDPIDLFSELDEERMETRKIEVFRNGTIGMASEDFETGDTRLGEVPVPAIDKIANDPQFFPTIIKKIDFENVWREGLQKLKDQVKH